MFNHRVMGAIIVGVLFFACLQSLQANDIKTEAIQQENGNLVEMVEVTFDEYVEAFRKQNSLGTFTASVDNSFSDSVLNIDLFEQSEPAVAKETSGELRKQIPEPGVLALVGLGGLLMYTRKNTREKNNA
ncbi:PEP-CTERM sorting domain-containing protein [Poriferisphaera sp. WC338]|uniref:PEP-CTERM sorting domain-containing protein n=1 Tax=Poriferisphaera sp. WC338 TaxID=3425129 RepID=UPI003D8148F2